MHRVALACLVALAQGTVAVAGPAERERGIARELARREGEEAERRGDFASCAAAFLRAFDIDSRQWGDEFLYNAGVCFERAAEVDAALSAWRRLAKGFPRSRLRARALVRSGILLARVARFEEAAAAFEEFATGHSAEPDAADAMSNAARLRFALGQHRQAIALTRRGMRTWKQTPVEQASALLFIASAEEEMGDRRAALRSLEQAARVAGGRDRELAHWIAVRTGALKSPRPREQPPALPEMIDRRGVMPDILWTAPLAP